VLGLLIFFPFTFVGLDFTDQGYHFFNQLVIRSPSDALNLSRMAWPVDWVCALAVRLLSIETLWGWRILGLLVWTSNYVLTVSLVSKVLPRQTPQQRWISFALTTALFLLSSKTVPEGMIVSPDYYSLPLLSALLSLHLFWTAITAPSLAAYLGLSASLFMLSYLRLTFAGLFLVMPILLWQQYRALRSFLFVLSALGLAIAVGYYVILKEALAGDLTGRYSLGVIVRLIANDVLALTRQCGISLAVGLASGLFARFRGATVSHGILTFASGAVLGLAVHSGLREEHLLQWLFVLLIISFLALAILRSEVITKQQRVFVIVALLYSVLLGFGSDSGILKMKYLLTPAMAPGLIILLCELPRWTRNTAAVSLLLISLVCLYHNLYREDLSAILQHPHFAQHPRVGSIIVSRWTQRALADFEKIEQKFAGRPRHYGPRVPLLNALSPLAARTPAWLEVLPLNRSIRAVEELCAIGGVFIETRFTLFEADRSRLVPPQLLRFRDHFLSRGGKLVEETPFFRVYECPRPT
jgi:hypothetical protein